MLLSRLVSAHCFQNLTQMAIYHSLLCFSWSKAITVCFQTMETNQMIFNRTFQLSERKILFIFSILSLKSVFCTYKKLIFFINISSMECANNFC